MVASEKGKRKDGKGKNKGKDERTGKSGGKPNQWGMLKNVRPSTQFQCRLDFHPCE